MKKEKGTRNSEKVRTSILFTFSLLLFTCSAAVPLSWTVETSRAQPATFEAYQGETLTFEAALQAKGKPLESPSNYSFFWQTNGMGSTYWEAPCPRLQPTPTNVLFATWLPAYDVGAKVYNCFIGSPSNIYHAAFQLRLRPSPGWTPNALPLPTPVIDFAKVRVLNPPWPTVETDPTVPSWAKEANPPAVDAYTKEQTDTKLADKADAAEVPQMARNAMSAEGISSSGINIGGNISGATVSDQYGNLRIAIGSKVSQSDYDSEVGSIWSSIGDKLDASNGSASYLTVTDSMTIPSMNSVYTYGYDPSWGSWRDMTLGEAISGACQSWCSGFIYDGAWLSYGLTFYPQACLWLYDGYEAIRDEYTGVSLGDTLSSIDSTVNSHVESYDNPHHVTPSQIGAITQDDISTNNPTFVSMVLATGMQLDPTAVAEFNEACRRGSLESNVVFHVRKYFKDTDSSHYYWDPVLQRTWQISVSNGCFFSEVVDNAFPY